MKPLLAFLLLFAPIALHAEPLAAFIPKGFTRGGPNPWTVGSENGQIDIAPGVRLVEGLQCGPGARSGGTPDSWGGGGFDSQSKQEALDKGAWFSFVLAPTTGKKISYSSLLATFFRGDKSASNYQWQYSVGDGEFKDIGEPASFTDSSLKGIASQPLDLFALKDLQNTSQPVTFRLLGWGASATGASWGFGKSSSQPVLVIEGTVD